MEQRQKTILIGVNVNNEPNFQESMVELKNLAIACELQVVGEAVQNLKSINNAYYVGSGKVEEVKGAVEATGAEVLVFDNELTPTQLRNLEKKLKCTIMDRTSLILEIFARRAKTREAKLQVEVARLKYMLPRLVGLNEELGRQSGGVGVRNKGLGETKLELDRRRIEGKIAELNKELELLERERETQRRKRNKGGLPTVALVGYTNAGKSTLMNAMVEMYQKSEEKKVFEKDMLFATLETSVRNITLPDNKAFLLSDTVGFISKLPHDLIKAFRTTLAEVREADLLLHVIDVSNDNYKEQLAVTNETLRQIGAEDIPIIYVYNKAEMTDRIVPHIEEDEIYISAKNKIGIEDLIGIMSQIIFKNYVRCRLFIPYDESKVTAYFNENAHVEAVSYENDGTVLMVECRQSDYMRYKSYVCQQQG